jgi:hypothetical protein
MAESTWNIVGADAETGEARTMSVRAKSRAGAEWQAQSAGVLVSSVTREQGSGGFPWPWQICGGKSFAIFVLWVQITFVAIIVVLIAQHGYEPPEDWERTRSERHERLMLASDPALVWFLISVPLFVVIVALWRRAPRS